MDDVRQTIYIDCTATYFVGFNTGIQRVVRNIVNRASAFDDDASRDCIPVVSFCGSFWKSESFTRLSPSTNTVATLRNCVSKVIFRLDSLEGSFRRNSGPVKSFSVLANLVFVIRRSIVFAGYAFFKMRFLGPLLSGRVRKVAPVPGDILLMPDAFWDYDIISPLLKPEYAPLTVVPVIHDLISITHPEYCVESYRRKFERLIPHLVRVSTRIIAISHATKDELLRYLERTGLSAKGTFPIVVWYSGADLASDPGKAPKMLPIREEISATYRKDNTFLMVGTIEPRKGYELVFESMSSLWEQGSTDHLVIVGRVGWLCGSLISRMKASPYFGRYLHIYADANDAELGFLYRNSIALIFASRAEGFGLPMVEAMWAGLAVIASDIPIFREIGDGYAKYFRPADAGDLARAISSVKNQRAPVASDPDYRWHTWNEATGQLLDLVQAPDLEDRQARG